MTQEVNHVYEDQWGGILHRPGLFAEIRWYDTTAQMDGTDFQVFLTEFADQVVEHKCRACLVDALSFRMNPANMNMGWRDKHIIPKYNAAGVEKFAFIVPAGVPAIGKPPEAEGPAEFPTAYFGTRSEALAWLGS